MVNISWNISYDIGSLMATVAVTVEFAFTVTVIDFVWLNDIHID